MIQESREAADVADGASDPVGYSLGVRGELASLPEPARACPQPLLPAPLLPPMPSVPPALLSVDPSVPVATRVRNSCGLLPSLCYLSLRLADGADDHR